MSRIARARSSLKDQSIPTNTFLIKTNAKEMIKIYLIFKKKHYQQNKPMRINTEAKGK